MISLYLTTDTNLEDTRPIRKERIKLPFLEEANTSIEPFSFTIIPNLNSVIRFFIEVKNREIKELIKESLDSIIRDIKNYEKLCELIEKNFIGLEELSRELIYLSKIYKLREPSKVLEFLSNNISLIPVVVEAYEKIKKYFPQADAVLEVISDPEATNEELVIFIRTSLSPDEAFKRLEQFDKDWWLDTSLKAGEKLCIHVEFKEDSIGQNI